MKYTDDENFLIHMINHHQVAIDMSEELEKKSNVPYMISLARNISYIQKYEIWVMKMTLERGIPNISLDDNKFEIWNPRYNIGCYYPNMSEDKNTKYEKHFFITNKKMLDNIDNINFLEHMIPHHQIAVNMSKERLLKTKNPHMLEFCNEIIKNQQYEIWSMKEILYQLRKIKLSKIPIQFHSKLFIINHKKNNQ